MEVQHRKSEDGGTFYIVFNDEPAAELVYSLVQGNRMVIEHTEVSDELRGRNIGQELVRAAVDFARESGMKVVPTCPFARAVLDKKPEWADVRA